jgi:hypothetical protein
MDFLMGGVEVGTWVLQINKESFQFLDGVSATEGMIRELSW